MRIVLIGDINGKAGRQILRSRFPSLVAERQVDFPLEQVTLMAGDQLGLCHECVRIPTQELTALT